MTISREPIASTVRHIDEFKCELNLHISMHPNPSVDSKHALLVQPSITLIDDKKVENLHIIFVIDCSLSMHEVIEDLKSSIKQWLSILPDSFSYTIVSYSDKGKLLTPVPVKRKEAQKTLDTMIAQGTTNIKGGFEQITKDNISENTIVIVTTDGEDDFVKNEENVNEFIKEIRKKFTRLLKIYPIGLGAEYNSTVMQSLGKATYSGCPHLSDANAIKDFFQDTGGASEFITNLIPVSLQVSVGEVLSYQINLECGIASNRPWITQRQIDLPRATPENMLFKIEYKGNNQVVTLERKVSKKELAIINYDVTERYAITKMLEIVNDLNSSHNDKIERLQQLFIYCEKDKNSYHMITKAIKLQEDIETAVGYASKNKILDASKYFTSDAIGVTMNFTGRTMVMNANNKKQEDEKKEDKAFSTLNQKYNFAKESPVKVKSVDAGIINREVITLDQEEERIKKTTTGIFQKVSQQKSKDSKDSKESERLSILLAIGQEVQKIFASPNISSIVGTHQSGIYSLARFMEAFCGRCRHISLFTAYVLGEAVKQRALLIDSNVYHLRGTAYNACGHTWVMYETHDNKKYLIDFTLKNSQQIFDLNKPQERQKALEAYKANDLEGVLVDLFKCYGFNDHPHMEQISEKVIEIVAPREEEFAAKNWVCCITAEIIRKPLGIRDNKGNVFLFEESAYLEWVQEHTLNPWTNLPLNECTRLSIDENRIIFREIWRKALTIIENLPPEQLPAEEHIHAENFGVSRRLKPVKEYCDTFTKDTSRQRKAQLLTYVRQQLLDPGLDKKSEEFIKLTSIQERLTKKNANVDKLSKEIETLKEVLALTGVGELPLTSAKKLKTLTPLEEKEKKVEDSGTTGLSSVSTEPSRFSKIVSFICEALGDFFSKVCQCFTRSDNRSPVSTRPAEKSKTEKPKDTSIIKSSTSEILVGQSDQSDSDMSIISPRSSIPRSSSASNNSWSIFCCFFPNSTQSSATSAISRTDSFQPRNKRPGDSP